MDWSSDFTALGMNKLVGAGALDASSSSPWSWCVAWFVLEQTSLGRTVLAVGGDDEASRLMGLE